MEQFTFYDLYFDVLSQLTDEEAGRFIKRICTYTVFEKDDTPSKSETENCFWEIILPHLRTQRKQNGKGKSRIISIVRCATLPLRLHMQG